MKKTLLLAIAFVMAGQAFALPYFQDVTITNIRIDADGRGIVFFDKPIQGDSAACGQSSSYKNAFAFNAAQPGGKAVFAYALTMKATNTKIGIVYGTGACNVYGNWVEDWSYSQ